MYDYIELKRTTRIFRMLGNTLYLNLNHYPANHDQMAIANSFYPDKTPSDSSSYPNISY